MIYQAAFTGEGPLLRGNLHLHTSRSDGKFTPEEAMKIYAENGYDFIALTDHGIYNKQNFAPDTGMLVIPGTEVHTQNIEPGFGHRVYHSVWLGEDSGNNGFAHDEKFDLSGVKSQDDLQKYLDDANRKNNMTIYCHPEWSQTPPRYFDKLKNLTAVEIWNTCSSERDYDINAPYWDDILGQGLMLWGIAVDDAHDARHYCGGWIMVNAEKNVSSILDAIKAGAFYSSCGPVIEDFCTDGKTARIKTAETCEKLLICSDKHVHRLGENCSVFETEIQADCRYIRAVVTDKAGRRAWTNPIFLD